MFLPITVAGSSSSAGDFRGCISDEHHFRGNAPVDCRLFKRSPGDGSTSDNGLPTLLAQEMRSLRSRILDQVREDAAAKWKAGRKDNFVKMYRVVVFILGFMATVNILTEHVMIFRASGICRQVLYHSEK